MKKKKFDHLLTQITLESNESSDVTNYIFSYAKDFESHWAIDELLRFEESIKEFAYSDNYFDFVQPFFKYIANMIHSVKYYGYVDSELTDKYQVLTNNVLENIDLEEYIIRQKLFDNSNFVKSIEECLNFSEHGIAQHFEFLANQSLILGEAKKNTIYTYLKNLIKSKAHKRNRVENAEKYVLSDELWELSANQLLNHIITERRRISLNHVGIEEGTSYANAFFLEYRDRSEKEAFFIDTFSFYDQYLGEIFSPVNPFLLITAIGISRILKEDYGDYIRNYIFCLDQTSLVQKLTDPYGEFSSEQCVSILKSEKEMWEGLTNLAKEILISNGKLVTDQIPTRWHLEWLYWCIINEPFKTASKLYQKVSLSLSSRFGLIINTWVHNARIRLKNRETEIKGELNLAFEQSSSNIDSILIDLEFCELALERIVLIYENLPHEIHAYGETEISFLNYDIKTLKSREELSRRSIDHKEKVIANFKRREIQTKPISGKFENSKIRPISEGEKDYFKEISNLNETELLDHYRNRLINSIKYRLLDIKTLNQMGYTYTEIFKN